jgi:hypothetical protein
MKNPGRNMINVTLIAAFIFVTLFLAGCGDNEMAKGIEEKD